MNAKDLKLDYFQIYDLDNPVKAGHIPWFQLQSVFDEKPVEVKLNALIKFADRVSKNGEPLFNPDAHLTGYALREYSAPFRRRTVVVANQFFPNAEELVIYQMVGVFVPAQKRTEKQAVFTKPPELSHYVVYRVISGPQFKSQTIELKDQFISRKVSVFEPRFFAIPAIKWYKDKKYVGGNPDIPLVIYQMTPSKNLPDVISARDQFLARRGLKLGISYRLAVPSKMHKWHEDGR